MSTLPPERTTPTRSSPEISWNRGERAAATDTAALGSMTIFIRIQTSRIAATISSSDTTSTSSTLSRMMGQVRSPMLVSSPSAMVLGSVCSIISPFCMLRAASSAPRGSAAKIRMLGWRPLAATQTPLRRPPPPTGTIKASRGSPPICHKNSRPVVPAPLMMSGWSYGGMNADPGCFAITACAVSSRSCRIGLHRTTFAPYSFTASTFTGEALDGITMYASRPACLDARASA
mmetsp:Transcript_49109/g.98490  ORF Transcript_49109/g.98490 Transcript_49109/m.98490 type:complete len:232 (-) Transcript_49109:40-735(-)